MLNCFTILLSLSSSRTSAGDGCLFHLEPRASDFKAPKNKIALSALTESESFDIFVGAAPSLLEALRRLVRRWDPLSGGKRRAFLRQILGSRSVQTARSSSGTRDVVRRYERNESSGTTTAALDEEIKTAAREALVPSVLEQHLALNRARLITYEQVQSAIQACIEAHRSQFALKTVAAKSTSDPMWLRR